MNIKNKKKLKETKELRKASNSLSEGVESS